jgi:enoyl-CoA hydratase/carnithine racemase
MSEQKNVRTSIEDHVITIAIDHPPANALDPQTLSDLECAVDEFMSDPNCKVAIISSSNPTVFVSGADIAAFSELAAVGNIKDFILKGQNLFRRISRCPKPIIAAVNGLALGGGLELILACHIRIISERAKLGFPEINLGIMPGWGGTQVLTRIAGSAKAIELILLGESISAQEALRLNIVNRMVPRSEVLPTAQELARKIAGKSSLATQAALESILAGTEMDIEEGLAYEADQLASLLGTEDAREGVQAFLEKRQPVYKGR